MMPVTIAEAVVPGITAPCSAAYPATYRSPVGPTRASADRWCHWRARPPCRCHEATSRGRARPGWRCQSPTPADAPRDAVGDLDPSRRVAEDEGPERTPRCPRARSTLPTGNAEQGLTGLRRPLISRSRLLLARQRLHRAPPCARGVDDLGELLAVRPADRNGSAVLEDGHVSPGGREN